MKPLKYFFASMAAWIIRSGDPRAPAAVRRLHLRPQDAAEMELLSAIFDTYDSRHVEGPRASPDDFAHGWLRLAMPSLNQVSGSPARQLAVTAAAAAARCAELAVMACQDQTWVLGATIDQFGAGAPASPAPRFSPYSGTLAGACAGWGYVVEALHRAGELRPEYQLGGDDATATLVQSLAEAAAGRQLDALRETYKHELLRLQSMALVEALKSADRPVVGQVQPPSVAVCGKSLTKELTDER